MFFVFNCCPITGLLRLLKHLILVMVRHSISDYMDLEIVFGSLRECHILKYMFLWVLRDALWAFEKSSVTP